MSPAIEFTWNRVSVQRLAYEAADSGLLSPDLAAGIRRVKGPKNLGVRLGNWLTADQAKALWQVPDVETQTHGSLPPGGRSVTPQLNRARNFVTEPRAQFGNRAARVSKRFCNPARNRAATERFRLFLQSTSQDPHRLQ